MCYKGTPVTKVFLTTPRHCFTKELFRRPPWSTLHDGVPNICVMKVHQSQAFLITPRFCFSKEHLLQVKKFFYKLIFSKCIMTFKRAPPLATPWEHDFFENDFLKLRHLPMCTVFSKWLLKSGAPPAPPSEHDFFQKWLLKVGHQLHHTLNRFTSLVGIGFW